MPNALYIEPFSGVAGDMLLSAFCGLADAYDDIVDLPKRLNLPDGRIELQQLDKNGIVCTHVRIVDTGHDRAHHADDSGQSDSSHSHHDHHHHHPHDHSHHHRHHRHLQDILDLIEAGDIAPGAKDIAKSIFTSIGEAESRIHNIPIEEIHFHEVSGVDSILDIVGCSVLLDRLEVAECYADPICVGHGQVKTQHGLLPVPAPATAELLRGMPTYKGEEAGERTTPTGAAILRYLKPRFAHPPRPVQKIAYGPGQKNFRSANVVRVSLLQPAEVAPGSDRIVVIETNLDDMAPEHLGTHFQDGLLAAGALDFTLTHVLMKKGRPGFLLSVLSPEDGKDAVMDHLLERTTALGVRWFPAERRILPRRKIAMETQHGTVSAKESTKPSGAKRLKPEFEALRQIADKENVSTHTISQRIQET